MKVSIIGQGYVGLTISAFAGEFYEVVGFDNNQKIVDQLNQGISHIEGVESSMLKRWIKAARYRATTNAADINGSDIVVIAVPTPLSKDRTPDLTLLKDACLSISKYLKISRGVA